MSKDEHCHKMPMPDTLIIVGRSILHTLQHLVIIFNFWQIIRMLSRLPSSMGQWKNLRPPRKHASVSLGQRINVLVIRQSIIDYFNFQYQIQYFGNLAIKINIKDLSIALYFENFGLRTSSLIFLALTLVRSIQECMHPYSYNTVCIQVEWRD